ncbi:hypothetical protein ABK040_011083 [Willaertia magna]
MSEPNSNNNESDGWDEEQHLQSIYQCFLGPHAENASTVDEIIGDIFSSWFAWRNQITNQFGKDDPFVTRSTCCTPKNQQNFKDIHKDLIDTTNSLISKLKDEIPFFSPRYIAHMTSEISIPAITGYIIGLLYNPNMVSFEASRASKVIEDEAIKEISDMFHFPELATGHFTCDGTIANFESVIRSKTRMADWIAMCAVALEYNLFNNDKEKIESINTLMKAAHCGWEKYDEIELLLKEKLEETKENKYKVLKKYHLLDYDYFEAAKNLEQLYGKFYSPIVLFPKSKHYSWPKSQIFGIGFNQFWEVDLDENGKLDVNHLKERIEEAKSKGIPIMMVVAVCGTTECGLFDPVHKIAALLKEYREKDHLDIYFHIDAAYGGFIASCLNVKTAPITSSIKEEENTIENVNNLEELLEKKEYTNYVKKIMGIDMIHCIQAFPLANSVTVDPHKLGFTPYACGSYLQRLEREYCYRKVDAPYIEFHDKERGNYTLEGSRASTGIFATWLTAKVIGFNYNGLGTILLHTIESRLDLETRLKNINHVYLIPKRDSNILCLSVSRKGENLEETNERNLRIVEELSPSNKEAQFIVSKTTFSYSKMVEKLVKEWDGKVTTVEDNKGVAKLKVIRIVIMNPFFYSRNPLHSLVPKFVDYFKHIVDKYTHKKRMN